MSTSSVADTAKYARSSTRKCFVGALGLRFRGERPGEGGKLGDASGEDGRNSPEDELPLIVREGEEGGGDVGSCGDRLS